MTYDLIIGDRLHSSWSLRGWLMFARFGIACNLRQVRMYSDEFDAVAQEFAPSRTVPAMRDGDTVVWDTGAMAEYLAERHEGLWPAAPEARALARCLVAEMHSGFGALRGFCPMNLRLAYKNVPVPDDVRADLSRIEALWALARARFGSGGPWLFGEYSLADAFYAPVAMRIAGYSLVVGAEAQAYVTAHLEDEVFRQWRACGFAENWHQSVYDKDYEVGPWPGPDPLAAQPVESGASVNADCPYSGRPVTHFLELGGKVYGFCNAFCRDKTVADPAAWPKFRALFEAA